MKYDLKFYEDEIKQLENKGIDVFLLLSLILRMEDNNIDVKEILSKIDFSKLNIKQIKTAIDREANMIESRKNSEYLGRKSIVKQSIEDIEYMIENYNKHEGMKPYDFEKIQEIYRDMSRKSKSTFIKFKKALKNNKLEEEVFRILGIEIKYTENSGIPYIES